MNQHTPPDTPLETHGEARLRELSTITGAKLSEQPCHPREFLDSAGLIPKRNTTIISGDGGTGKSLLALQLLCATALTGNWLGMTIERGPVLYFSAEDDLNEIHIRLQEISKVEQFELTDLDQLHITPLAGEEAVLGFTDKNGIIKKTELMKRLRMTMNVIRPSLLVLDNLADIFGGNEIIKSEARQFMTTLRGLAMGYDCAVVLLAHPSISGMSSGTGTSGNVAWNNSARSRLYLERVIAGDNKETNPNRRSIKTKKANYGPTGGRIDIEWCRGAFVPLSGTSPGPLSKEQREAKAERVFMDILSKFLDQGRDVSANISPTFAPTQFVKEPDNEGVSKHDFDVAMRSLINRKVIETEHTGPASRRRSRLVFCDRGSEDE